MGFPTKNDHDLGCFGGTTILGNTHEIPNKTSQELGSITLLSPSAFPIAPSLRSCNTRPCHRSRRPIREISLCQENLVRKTRWVFPTIGVGPQNGWFLWKILLKWMIWEDPYFRKHPDAGIGGITHPNCVFDSPCFGHFKRR